MIIDGKAIAQEIHNDVKHAVARLSGRPPGLAVILVGEDPASHIYVKRKTEACEAVGIHSTRHYFPENTTEEQLLDVIHSLNRNPDVDGILVQVPLPKHINVMRVTETIDPHKDVDGFHPTNVGKVLIGLKDGYAPCTPLGVIRLLEKSHVSLEGKHVVVIGRSAIVGKPMAALLMQNGPHATASVTVLHRFTPDIAPFCEQADILIVAVGIPGLIKKEMVKKGAVIIDIGINQIPDPKKKSGFRIVGDVDYEDVKGVCGMITPVPGGVGPVTIAVLLENTLKSYLASHA